MRRGDHDAGRITITLSLLDPASETPLLINLRIGDPPSPLLPLLPPRDTTTSPAPEPARCLLPTRFPRAVDARVAGAGAGDVGVRMKVEGEGRAEERFLVIWWVGGGGGGRGGGTSMMMRMMRGDGIVVAIGSDAAVAVAREGELVVVVVPVVG